VNVQSTNNISSSERGIALIFALILLVVITLLGLGAMRSTGLMQKIMANFYDRSIAFQNAEAGLQAGAQALTGGTAVIARNCGQGGVACKGDPFSELAAGNIQTVASGTGNGMYAKALNAFSQPQYVIENMGTWPDPSTSTGFGQTANSAQYGAQGATTTAVYYRITARSGDPAAIGDRAVVTLQAMYKQ